MRVSVVIPTYDEASSIARVLDEIPAAFVTEVLVVDAGSTDGTREIAAAHGARVIFEPRRGYGRACLTGLAAANDPDTVVFLDMRWWICAWRALVRGIRTRAVNFELPNGCDESRLRRLRDEWCLVWRIWRVRRSERERELKILSQHGKHVTTHVLRSKRAVREFLDV